MRDCKNGRILNEAKLYTHEISKRSEMVSFDVGALPYEVWFGRLP